MIILGYMNAHIEGLDEYKELTGSISLELVEKHDLALCNTSRKCDGHITLETANLHSSIDYVVMSQKIHGKLQVMKTDKEVSRSLGGDHKRIKLNFAREVNAETRQHNSKQTFCSDTELEIVAERIEEAILGQRHRDWTYESLTIGFLLWNSTKLNERGSKDIDQKAGGTKN
ncbi:hypothetical protein ANAPRD1_01184 [Anaplasma phagocytophilum]|nr:hypothetical protein ANAPRD1_01184 [Anaplasma phagocytophilum]